MTKLGELRALAAASGGGPISLRVYRIALAKAAPDLFALAQAALDVSTAPIEHEARNYLSAQVNPEAWRALQAAASKVQP